MARWLGAACGVLLLALAIGLTASTVSRASSPHTLAKTEARLTQVSGKTRAARHRHHLVSYRRHHHRLSRQHFASGSHHRHFLPQQIRPSVVASRMGAAAREATCGTSDRNCIDPTDPDRSLFMATRRARAEGVPVVVLRFGFDDWLERRNQAAGVSREALLQVYRERVAFVHSAVASKPDWRSIRPDVRHPAVST